MNRREFLKANQALRVPHRIVCTNCGQGTTDMLAEHEARVFNRVLEVTRERRTGVDHRCKRWALAAAEREPSDRCGGQLTVQSA